MTDGAPERPGLIVYVDTVSLEWAVGMSIHAGMRGLATALVCPPGEVPGVHDFAAVVETDDFGIEAVDAVLRDLERTWRIRGITSSFGAFRGEAFVHGTVAELARRRGLASSPVEALYRATNKYLARDAAAAAGLDVGGFAVVDTVEAAVDAARRIGCPVVLKPLTGVGSSAILRCDSEDDVRRRFPAGLRLLATGHYPQLRMAAHRACDAAGREHRFDPSFSLLMEEYFPGAEASVECLAVDGRVVPLLVHDKILVEERDNVVLEHVLVTPPERFTAEQVAEMEQYAAAAVTALGLRWSFCHVELRYVEGAGPRLLEVNPRIGAGCVLDSIETFWGFDVADMALDLVLGHAQVPVRRPRSVERHGLAFLFSPRSGVLDRFAGLDRVRALPEVRRVRPGFRAGARVGGDSEEVFLASVFMQVDDGAAALDAFERVRAAVDISVVPG